MLGQQSDDVNKAEALLEVDYEKILDTKLQILKSDIAGMLTQQRDCLLVKLDSNSNKIEQIARHLNIEWVNKP